MDLKDDNYFYMYTKLYDSLDNHNYRLAHDLAVILYLSKPTAEFFYSYLYCLTKGIEDFDVEILLRICKDKHLREYLRGLYFAVLQEWSSSKEAFNRALSILNKRNQFHLYYISLEGENVILDMKDADLQMVVSDILTELKIIMQFENPIIIMKQPRPTQDIFRLSYSIRKPEEPGAENKYFIDRAFSSLSDPQFDLAIQEIAKKIKKVYYETDPKTQKEILREDVYKNFVVKIQKVIKLLNKEKTPKRTYLINKYNRIKAEDDKPADQNLWHKDDVVWRISYEGIPVKIQDLVGLTYIGHLLQDPFKEYSLSELDELVNPGKIDIDSPSVKNVGPGESFDVLSSGGKKPRYEEKTDRKSIESYKKDIKRLKDRIRYAELTENNEEAQQLREEKESVEGHLNKSTSFFSKKPLLTVPQLELIRKKIYNDVKYSIKVINKKHKPLANHLRQFIKIGKYSRYIPSPEISWDVQL